MASAAVRERLERPPGRPVLAGLPRRRGSTHPLPARRRHRPSRRWCCCTGPAATPRPTFATSRRTPSTSRPGRSTCSATATPTSRAIRSRSRTTSTICSRSSTPSAPSACTYQRRVAGRLGRRPRRRRPSGPHRPPGAQHRRRFAGRSRGDEAHHHAVDGRGREPDLGDRAGAHQVADGRQDQGLRRHRRQPAADLPPAGLRRRR